MTKKRVAVMTDVQIKVIADDYLTELISNVIENPILVDGLTGLQIGQRVFEMVRFDIGLFVKAILSLGTEVGHVSNVEDKRYLVKEGIEIGTAFNCCFKKKFKIMPRKYELRKKIG